MKTLALIGSYPTLGSDPTHQFVPFRWILSITLMLAALFAPHSANAASPGLQLNPLKYEDTLTTDKVRTGFIDVGNPSDTTITVKTDVQGFKQANLDGDLEFFLDDPIKQGIKIGLDQFTLGPREAIRVSFLVDPTKLPKGGVYAAVFFRTVPPAQATTATSYVTESANVGTLLLLQNGPGGERIGRIAQFDLPFFQFGAGLKGAAQYQNTNRTTAPIAFAPELELRALPWSRPAKFAGPYVLPGSTRQFSLDHPGAYFGLLPVSLTDAASGARTTRWILACTGAYSYALLVLLAIILVLAAFRLIRRQPLLPKPPRLHRSVRQWWRRLRRRKPPVTKRPLDGLGPRPTPPAPAEPDASQSPID